MARPAGRNLSNVASDIISNVEGGRSVPVIIVLVNSSASLLLQNIINYCQKLQVLTGNHVWTSYTASSSTRP